MRPANWTHPLQILVVALWGVWGCGTTKVDCLCTAEFVRITVSAVDVSENPVTDLYIEVRVSRNGEILNIEQDPFLKDQGVYVVFDDGFRDRIHPKVSLLGETLEVTGLGSKGYFEATYKVSVDGECACHVQKKSGPDKVVVEDLGAAN